MTEFIITILGFLIIILGWIVHRKTERIKIIENQLSERKYQAYADMVALFYSILKDTKSKKNTNQKGMMEKMIDSKRDILMYGSDEVFCKFNKWLCASNESEFVNEDKKLYHMKYFLEFILAIRKDMQGYKSKITEREILINLVQNEKEVDKLLKELNL